MVPGTLLVLNKYSLSELGKIQSLPHWLSVLPAVCEHIQFVSLSKRPKSPLILFFLELQNAKLKETIHNASSLPTIAFSVITYHIQDS